MCTTQQTHGLGNNIGPIDFLSEKWNQHGGDLTCNTSFHGQPITCSVTIQPRKWSPNHVPLHMLHLDFYIRPTYMVPSRAKTRQQERQRCTEWTKTYFYLHKAECWDRPSRRQPYNEYGFVTHSSTCFRSVSNFMSYASSIRQRSFLLGLFTAFPSLRLNQLW